jgi:hypothetical protein
LPSLPTIEDFFKLLTETDPNEIKRLYDLKNEVHQNIEKSRAAELSLANERRRIETQLLAIRDAEYNLEQEKDKMKAAFNLREASNEQREHRILEKEKALQDKEVQLNHREANIAARENAQGRNEQQLMEISRQVSERKLKIDSVTEDLREYLCRLT